MVMTSMKPAVLIFMGLSLTIGTPQQVRATPKDKAIVPALVFSYIVVFYGTAAYLRYYHNLEVQQKEAAKKNKDNPLQLSAPKPVDYGTLTYKLRKFIENNDSSLDAITWRRVKIAAIKK